MNLKNFQKKQKLNYLQDINMKTNRNMENKDDTTEKIKIILIYLFKI